MYRTTVNGTVTGTIPLFHEEMPGNTPQMPCPTEDETVINRPHPAQQGRAVNTVAGIYYCCCSSARWFGVDIRYSLVQYDTGKPVFRWDTKNEKNKCVKKSGKCVKREQTNKMRRLSVSIVPYMHVPVSGVGITGGLFEPTRWASQRADKSC